MRTAIARRLTLLSLCLAAGVAGACGKKERPAAEDTVVAITDIDLGRSVKADATINDATATFSPSDVIYVSVGTKGRGQGTLRARWVRGETEEIAADSRTLDITGPNHTEFHIARPNGLPKGDYRVEITLNGVSAGHERFTVN